ncbi:Aste57867_21688 [Aphanomyces stellatus]|uniref:Aste57867_21688 protein n=1 Tax=Aphanomyces stellatus TaxID=120398 RepID=A0A485LK95_9STRA|nr:hypothetical protein As57867_021619 [Aphanomyces stellatus]VFT98357.1 Aste57867_21688 [Aphanomyces stellatus]
MYTNDTALGWDDEGGRMSVADSRLLRWFDATMARRKQPNPKRQAGSGGASASDAQGAGDQPPAKRARGKRSRAKQTSRLENPYCLQALANRTDCLTLRVPLPEASRERIAFLDASTLASDGALLVIGRPADDAVVEYASVHLQHPNASTATIELLHATATADDEPSVNSKVLHAIAFLNDKRCVGLLVDGTHIQVTVDMATYAALSGGRDVTASYTPMSKHMGTFMRWAIQACDDTWNFPYPSELGDEREDSHFQPASLCKLIPARPFTAAGDAYAPSPTLLPALRRYQKAAVAWMLQREGDPTMTLGPSNVMPTTVCTFHEASGVGYDPFSALFYPHGPPPSLDLTRVRGGVLADEMGLGKTVQVLSCILSHPSPPIVNDVPEAVDAALADNADPRSCVCNCTEDEPLGWVQCNRCAVWQHRLCTGATDDDATAFYCDACLRHLVPQWRAPSTLIISPQSIHKQWEREILRHTKPGSLTLLTYHGIKAMRARLKGRPSSEWTQCRASELAKWDVVLTTYETLKDDLYHVAACGQTTGSRRHKKRYRLVASPLTHLVWWRVCMDEAQLVENTQTKASLMALELQSTLRWCVSGTPFSTGLWDVYGTLAFLQVSPFDEKAWWRAVVMGHTSTSARLGDLVRALTWRNQKQDVIDQINLPPQQTHWSWLDLSNIESHFYNQQMEECTKQRSQTKDVTAGMLHSLLRLRQACCHPQVGSNGLKSLNDSGPLNMDEVLTEMMQRAQRECEDGQRTLLGALNGLAALSVVEGVPDAAVAMYFEALSLIRHNWNDFRADLLPRLHLVHNFALVLDRYGGDASATAASPDAPFVNAKQNHCLPTLAAIKHLIGDDDGAHLSDRLADASSRAAIRAARDEMRMSAHQIESFYLSQVNTIHDAALNKYNTLYNEIQGEHFRRATGAAPLPESFHAGWMDATMHIADESTFIDRVRAKLMSRSVSMGLTLATKIQSMTSLRAVVMQEFTKIFLLRAANHKTLLALSAALPTKDEIDRSGNCKYCREARDGNKCQHCHFKPEMDRLRAMLGISDEETQSATHSQYNLAALLLDVVYEAARESGRMEAHEHLATILGDVRKERFLAMKLWKAQHGRLGGLDELEMAKTTIQLRQPHDAVREVDKSYKLLAGEVPEKRLKLEDERQVAVKKLGSKLSQLRYLQHLHRVRNQASDEDDVVCVVCREVMQAKRGVWPCAHVFCLDCTELLMKRGDGTGSKRSGVRCPTCRMVTPASKIMLVRDDNRVGRRDAAVGYGTKVDSVVACVQGLGPHAKSLLFSQWPDMLKLMHQALTSAGVHCFIVTQKKEFEKILTQFKLYPDACVLAMAFKHGANGLNVIEATHVVLIEPLLNGGVEAQAVNRVHRLGQDRETTVHKFIVRNSVEEGILVLQAARQKQAHVVKKNDKELVTWSDWNMLLQLENVDVYDAFWSEEVTWRGRTMTRQQVKEQLERTLSFDLYRDGRRLVDLPRMMVCGVEMAVAVAEQLVQECTVSDTKLADVVDTLRHRLEIYATTQQQQT